MGALALGMICRSWRPFVFTALHRLLRRSRAASSSSFIMLLYTCRANDGARIRAHALCVAHETAVYERTKQVKEQSGNGQTNSEVGRTDRCDHSETFPDQERTCEYFSTVILRHDNSKKGRPPCVRVR